MSIFDHQRITNEIFKLDIERMRRGWYSDKYFENIGRMLKTLASEGYHYSGANPKLPKGVSAENIAVGDIEVEMQWFTRRVGNTVVVGVDKFLEMLRHCTGYWEDDTFIDTADKLEVWAIHDGTIVKSDGNPLNSEVVLKVRGRYRDFALLETPTLGVLTRSSRVATNVYETLMAAIRKAVEKNDGSQVVHYYFQIYPMPLGLAPTPQGVSVPVVEGVRINASLANFALLRNDNVGFVSYVGISNVATVKTEISIGGSLKFTGNAPPDSNGIYALAAGVGVNRGNYLLLSVDNATGAAQWSSFIGFGQ